MGTDQGEPLWIKSNLSARHANVSQRGKELGSEWRI